MSNPLIGFAVVCSVSGGLCLLIWLVSRSLKQRGLIVPRQEPIREWVEFANARDALLRTIAKELRLDRIADWLAAKFRRP